MLSSHSNKLAKHSDCITLFISECWRRRQALGSRYQRNSFFCAHEVGGINANSASAKTQLHVQLREVPNCIHPSYIYIHILLIYFLSINLSIYLFVYLFVYFCLFVVYLCILFISLFIYLSIYSFSKKWFFQW